MTNNSNPPTTCIGRLAPSPTGAQHVGNARTYLLAWLSVRLQGGQLRLRIEDIDSPRVKPWSIAETIEDLHWLGLDWDAMETRSGHAQGTSDAKVPAGVWLQTERVSIYEHYLQALLHAGRLYPCYCSRKDIEAAASAPHREDQMLRYPDTCRDRVGPSEIFPHRQSGLQNEDKSIGQDDPSARPFAWRFRSQEEVIDFDDLVCGRQSSRPHQDVGDFVIAKSNGHVAYQLAVVVDDHQMGVTEVVRGDDLIPSTFWQLEIYRAFGWTPPKFCHVPLVVGMDGRRLAKRHGDTRLSEIRRRGLGPEKLLGELAFSCGWLESPRSMAAREILDLLARSTLMGLSNTGQNTVWQKLPHHPYVLSDSTWRAILNGTEGG